MEGGNLSVFRGCVKMDAHDEFSGKYDCDWRYVWIFSACPCSSAEGEAQKTRIREQPQDLVSMHFFVHSSQPNAKEQLLNSSVSQITNENVSLLPHLIHKQIIE